MTERMARSVGAGPLDEGGRPRVDITQVCADDDDALDRITELHMELLDFGPMAALGPLFIREVCYRLLMQDGILRTAICRVGGVPAGFVSYTPRSVGFHRSSLRRHWARVGLALARALLTDPRRLGALAKALRTLASRSEDREQLRDPLGEIVCLAVRPDFARVRLRGGSRVSEALVQLAMAELSAQGIDRMRILVDRANKAPLLLYRHFGARFRACRFGGAPTIEAWFDLEPPPGRPASGAREEPRGNTRRHPEPSAEAPRPSPP